MAVPAEESIVATVTASVIHTFFLFIRIVCRYWLFAMGAGLGVEPKFLDYKTSVVTSGLPRHVFGFSGPPRPGRFLASTSKAGRPHGARRDMWKLIALLISRVRSAREPSRDGEYIRLHRCMC